MAISSRALEHTTIDVSGMRLHCVQAGPVDGKPVLLLHGFPEFWYGWRKQIPALADAGYRVWAPDQRGYNLSVRPRSKRAYSLNLLADDIQGLITRTGHEKVYLVGHDWGAAVAWRVAMVYPELIEKLVIINSPHPLVMMEMLQKDREQQRRSWYMGIFQVPWLPERLMQQGNWRAMVRSLQKTSLPGTFSEEDLQLYREAWSQPGAITAMINWYRAMRRYPPMFPVQIDITVPTLIMWGKEDRFLKAEAASRSLEYCKQGELRYFDDATHWVHHEKADEVNAAMLRFFQG